VRRGIRIRDASGEPPVYFRGSRAASQQWITALAGRGVRLTGQVTPRRLPYMISYAYPDADLEPIPGA